MSSSDSIGLGSRCLEFRQRDPVGKVTLDQASLAIQRSHERTATSARAREADSLQAACEVALIRAQVVVSQVIHGERVVVSFQKSDQLVELGRISPTVFGLRFASS